jgi:hypothetical protein
MKYWEQVQILNGQQDPIDFNVLLKLSLMHRV